MLYIAEIALTYYGYYFLSVFLLTAIVFLLFLTVWSDKLDGDSHQDIIDMDEIMTVINFEAYKRRKEDTA